MLDSIFPFAELPWLRYFLALMITFFGLWVVFSPPASVIAPMLESLRAQLRGAIVGIAEQFTAFRTKRRKHRQQQRKHALLAGTFVEKIDRRKLRLWQETVSAMARPLTDLSRQLHESDLKFASVSKQLPEVADRLAHFRPGSIELEGPGRISNLPLAATREAWPNFVIGLFLLACVTVVNTGMLAQILSDGIIPQHLLVGPIPLFWLLAILLTLIEAGTGYLHSILREWSHFRKLAPAPMLTIAAALSVAFVEGFFYSRIGADRPEVFNVPLLDVSVPFEHIFFVWGFVLVMTLFAFGLVTHRTLLTIRRAGSSDAIRGRMRAVHDELSEMTTAVGKMAFTLNSSVAEALTSHAKVRKHKTEEGTIDTALLKLTRELEVLRERPPEWVEVNYAQAEEADWHHMEIRAAVTVWLSVLLTAVITLMAMPWLERLIGGVSSAYLILVALGYSILFPAAGLLLRNASSRRLEVNAPEEELTLIQRISRPDRVVLSALVLSTGVLGFQSLFAGSAGAWVVGAALGVLLVLCGRELGSVLFFAGMHLARLWDTAVSAGQRLLVVGLWSIYLVLFLLEYACRFIAAPRDAFFRPRGETEAPVGAVQSEVRP